MSTSPPPDPWRPEPMWDQLFELDEARRASVLPRGLKRRRWLKPALIASAALVVVVAVVALVVWLLRPEPPSETTSGATESTETTDPQAQRRLAQLLPAGYSPDACTPAAAPSAPDVLATVTCGENTDPSGPPRATYTLLSDKAALSDAFDAVVASSTTVVCPGRIQSPGPWRRNATPDQVSGILFCGTQQGRPMVAWTDEASMVLSQVHADEAGPTFPELYAWWSSHS